jgi:hypothetical protein
VWLAIFFPAIALVLMAARVKKKPRPSEPGFLVILRVLLLALIGLFVAILFAGAGSTT